MTAMIANTEMTAFLRMAQASKIILCKTWSIVYTTLCILQEIYFLCLTTI